MDNESIRFCAEETRKWLLQRQRTFSAKSLTIREKNLTLKYFSSEDCAENYHELFPREILLFEEAEKLIYPFEEPRKPPAKVSWSEHWLAVVQRLGISYALLEKTVISVIASPLRLHPHIFPYLCWIITENGIVTVVDSFIGEDFLPLETVLRFFSSNIDYDSQIVNFMTAQIAETFGQLYGLGLNVSLKLHSLFCDDAMFLLFDPISSLFHETRIDLDECTRQWVAGRRSNYEYLCDLNRAAGRRRGEAHNHPIFPWICDFTKKDGGWRPLNRTKFRMNKGDDQLREMYNRTPAHHVSELLSDIGYMVYRARIESKERLCRHVRSKWVPLEYPVSVARCYAWTPDECIPEFFDSPEIFKSIHPDMPDLELPSFIKSPQEFIQWHRQILESDEVSKNLHQWIDLTFGYLLSGDEAVRSLNVHLSLVEKSGNRLRRWGVVQLFDKPHPKRQRADDSIEDKLEQWISKMGNEETKEEIDEDSLVVLYRKLRSQRVEEYSQLMRSIFWLLAQISLAPVALGRFEKDWLKRNCRQHSHLLPLPLQEIIDQFCLKVNTLPSPKEFILWLLTEMNVPFPLVSHHDQLATFYSLHLLRRSIVMGNDHNKIQAALAKEAEALKRFVADSDDMQFVVVPLVRRLLEDPSSAVNVAHRLMVVVARSVDEQSLQNLVPVLVDLISNEQSSVKLLDRRFLLTLSVTYGAPKFFDVFLPPLVEAVVSKKYDRSVVAKESILWLSKRYGPVVCARYLSANLLRIMGSCYDGMFLIGSDQEPKAIFSIPMEGDTQCLRVLEALTEIAATYSVTFITTQYIPFCVDLVEQWHKRATPALEAGLVAILRLLSLSSNAMSDHLLMNYLQEYIMNKILSRIIHSCLQNGSQFSSARNRIIVLCKAISVLHEVAIRVGAEVARTHMKAPFASLFNCFTALYYADDELKIKERAQPPQEYFAVPLWLATATVDRFVLDWGVPLLTALCPDPAFLVPFVTNLAPSIGSPRNSQYLPFQPHFQLSGSLPSGNRLYSPGISTSPATIGGLAPCDSGSLSALWCARVAVAAVSSQNRTTYRLDQLNLCSFEGHTGAIKCITALSNENSYISSSSDKTVKLWSMKCEQEKVDAQWTYTAHTRAVVSIVTMSDSSIASADGTVHVWDPFKGCSLFQLDWQEGLVSSLAVIDRSTVAAISSLHQTIRLFDVRVGYWTAELKAANSSGITKAVTIHKSSHKMAVALSNGTVIVMDSRTGKICSLSHGNSTHPTGIHWLTETDFLICDSDEPAAIFSANPRIIVNWKLPDVASSACFDGQMLTTLQGSSTLRMYNEREQVLETKIRGDPTSILRLPLNNAFLIGYQNGSMNLMC